MATSIPISSIPSIEISSIPSIEIPSIPSIATPIDAPIAASIIAPIDAQIIAPIDAQISAQIKTSRIQTASNPAIGEIIGIQIIEGPSIGGCGEIIAEGDGIGAGNPIIEAPRENPIIPICPQV